MNTLVLEAEPIAVAIRVTDAWLTVDLLDGRALCIPLSWYPRLVHATPDERAHWRLLGEGYAIEWPELDEHIGIEGLLAGRRTGLDAPVATGAPKPVRDRQQPHGPTPALFLANQPKAYFESCPLMAPAG